jgi:nitrogen fixation protein NifU and related proteins
MYSEQALDHFHHPRNVGELDAPAAVTEVSNPICGDVMKLWVLVRDGRVCKTRFKVQGCVPAVACGSWLTEAIQDKPISELSLITAEQVETGLGGLPPASRHAPALAVEALRRTLENLHDRNVAK